jgi:hypothetical protein
MEAICSPKRRFELELHGTKSQKASMTSRFLLVKSVLRTTSWLKNGVFWEITPCGSCKNRRFGGTQRLHRQGDKNR